MKISSFGGIIAAANEKSAFPLQKIGDTTAVKRIVATFQQAGIFPIAIMSGAEEDEVRYQLSSSGVVFLQPEQNEPELFESARTGFSFLQDCCDKIVFTPVNTPMFSPLTLRTLMKANGEIISPSCHKTGGHPMIVSTDIVPEILTYHGGRGLRGAVSSMESRRVRLDVDDEGILYTVHHGDVPAKILNQHTNESLYLSAELRLKNDIAIFDSRTKLLLLLIWKNHSVKAACEQMALSYSKAWDMLNELEASLHVGLITRKHGGVNGGRTTLSERGILFLQRFQRLEEDIHRYANGQLDTLKSALQL